MKPMASNPMRKIFASFGHEVNQSTAMLSCVLEGMASVREPELLLFPGFFSLSRPFCTELFRSRISVGRE